VRCWYITFSGAAYDRTTQRIVEDAPKFGADEVLVYDDQWLEAHPFRQLNKWMWEHPGRHQPRFGCGFYAFKPLIILETFKRMAAGDVCLFTDADTYPIADLAVVYETAARDGAMLFAASWWRQIQWCKSDCYVVMAQRADAAAKAGVARFMAFQKGPWKPYQLLLEWLTYCVNPSATTFDHSVLRGGEHPEFREHRTEQAILSNLAHKYGYKLHREACQAGEGRSEDRDLYPTLFHQDNDQPGCVTGESLGSRFRNV
jgi:hypothetical protein